MADEARRARLNSGDVRAGGFQRKSYGVGRLGTLRKAETHQGGQVQKWELRRALNLEEESSEHLRGTHSVQVQHCTDLPLQVIFPAHIELGNMGLELG